MIAYTKLQLKKILRVEFIRFCIVGGTGFIINFLLLILLHKILKIEIFISQIIGAEVALLSNFLLHHHWTYKYHKVEKSKTKLIAQFHATSWPAIFGSALMVTLGENYLHLSNLFALMLSSIIVLMWNFGWSKFIIWRDVSSPDINRIVK